MGIVGRDNELARIDGFLEELRSGPARLAVVGEPGIGKTTMWEAGVAAAAERGFRVLAARPTGTESSLAYAGLTDLLAGVEDSAFDPLPYPQRLALDVALLRAVDERPADPRAVFAGFGGVVAALALEQPVLVAIDDLQWLDGPSAAAVEFVGRRLHTERVAVLASSRVDEEPRSSWLEERDHLRLQPLSAGALHRLIKDRTGVAVPRPTLMRLHAACGGNAFFALEIARALVEQDALDAGDTWPLTDDIRELVLHRIARLPVAERDALLVAAAGGKDVEVRDVRRAERAGLVQADATRGIRFAHPLYASAVYLGASPEARRRAHAALAAGAESLERAHHLALATEHPDARIAEELDRASRLAVARGAPGIAAELSERAAELTPVGEDDAAAARTLTAAALHLHGGASARAGRMLGPLLEDSERAVHAEALHLLSQVRFREENFAEALPLLHAVAAHPGADLELRATVELELAVTWTAISYDHKPAEELAAAAVEHAAASGNNALLASALAVKTLVAFLLGHGVDEAQLARALELEGTDHRLPVEARPSVIAGCLALYTGRVERAGALLYPLRTDLHERGEDADLPLISIHLAWLELALGRTDAARALVDEALELASLAGSLTAHALAFASLLDAYTGDAERCRDRAAAALAEMGTAELCLVIDWTAWATGALELSLGNLEAADDALESHTREFEEAELVEPIHLSYLPDKIEALVGLGRLERAERLADLLAAMGDRFERPVTQAGARRSRGAILAARGELRDAELVLQSGLAILESAPLPLEIARTLLLLGQVERRRKQWSRARVSLERALATCEEIGAKAWAERVRAEIARLGERRPPGELTETERRVAELAATGLTNREIASVAFMSQKTVEANLSRIYRKLGIRSRAQIALRLAEPTAH